MILCPSTLRELSEQLAAAREPLSGVDLRAFNHVVEHTPEDMTATVQGGATLAALQERLAARGQWLPLDPPNAEQLTISQLLASSASGPRRFGYGTVRDYVIGLKAVLPDGRVIQSGGKVVKNVAGYDLAKLFIGSRGSLGVIVEATFKLRPLPSREGFVECVCESADAASKLLGAMLDSELSPVVVDMRNCGAGGDLPWRIIIGFAGGAEEVDWQLARARELGVANDSSLNYEKEFWDGCGEKGPQKISVLPSKLIETAREVRGAFVARAGNGILYHRDERLAAKKIPPSDLARRLTQSFDPRNILPELLA
jgi:glycolate oxidase FAD binding subunit